MYKALATLTLGLSVSIASYAQFSQNVLTNQIDISTGFDYATSSNYAQSTSAVHVLDHYWQVSSMPSNSTGLTAPKCAERLLNTLISSGIWQDSPNCSFIGVVADAEANNTAQLSPTTNFFWNCPNTTPYYPTKPATVFSRHFYVQSSNPTELITVMIPNFQADDYAIIYLDNNTANPIYKNPAVSTTGGVAPGAVMFNVAPGVHTIDIYLWDISGGGSAVKMNGNISAKTKVLVNNSAYGITNQQCVMPPPNPCNADFTAQVTLNSNSGTGALGIADKSVQLTLQNQHPTSTYTVDYGNGFVPFAAAPSVYTFTTGGSHYITVSETTSAGIQCKASYYFCIEGGNASARPAAPQEGATGISSAPPEEDAKVTISPNPASSMADIALETRADSKVRIIVIDASGKVVAEVFQGFMPKGKQSFSVNTGRFSTGLYQVKIIVGNQVSTHKLSVIR